MNHPLPYPRKPYTLAFLGFLILFVLGSLNPLQAQAANLISNGDFKDQMNNWNVYSHLAGKKPQAEIVTGPETNESALQVTVPEETELKKFMVGASQVINHDIPADTSVTLRFMARSAQSVSIAAVLHTVAEPHQNKLYQKFDLTPEWSSYETVGRKPVGFANGEAQLEFFLSFASGQIEISKVELISE